MTRIELPREKKVGHLTLLREPRAITPKEFNLLSASERLDLVRRARGKQKHDLLIEAKDGEALVRHLSAQEVYLMVKEIGAEEATELLGMVTTGQFTAFLDLDCWGEGLFDGEEALKWITLLLETGEEKALATALEMELELLVLILSRFITISGGLADLHDEDALHEHRDLDRIYDITYHDPETAKIVGAFLDMLYRRERDFYLGLLEAVRSEPGAELEETALQFRRDRLQDHGFPDPVEALGAYAWVDPDAFDPARKTKAPPQLPDGSAEAPGYLLTAARPGALLAEVLSGGIESATAWELTFLCNKVMMADRVDIGDLEQVRIAMEEVYLYLELGLAHLVGDDVEKAARLFGETYLEHLFRLGFSLTLRLQQRARKVKASLVAPYLDGPDRALVEALCRRKPRFFAGADDQTRGGERPFAAPRDLRLAEELLARVEAQVRLFTAGLPFALPDPKVLDLTGCHPAEAADLALSDFFLTALGNRLLGRPFAPEPIPVGELSRLQTIVCEAGKVSPRLRLETRQWVETLEQGAGPFADYCLTLWDEEFCTLAPEELDPRYLGGLIVRTG